MSQTQETPLMEKIVSLCKRRGFIFQSSEIYGGINGFWDYGPLGAELKRNLRDTWWRAMTRDREDVVGLDATIILHPAIWKASGHVDTFSDPMCDCLVTKKRFRADHIEPQSGIVYSWTGATGQISGEKVSDVFESEVVPILNDLDIPVSQFWNDLCKFRDERGTWHEAVRVACDYWPATEPHREVIQELLSMENSIPFSVLLLPGKPADSARKTAAQFYATRGLENPTLLGETISKVENSRGFNPENGAQLTPPIAFNLMFHTYVGATATPDDKAYLRPETAQAIFVQFKNVVDSSRQKVPFGICQIGKAFRNEVTPRNFTFRSREFEQMELEFFIKPDEAIEAVCGSVAKWSEGADLSEPRDNWGWEMWHRYWVAQRTAYYHSIGLGTDVLDYHWQTKEELAHYARACVDILFKFPFGTDELEGIAARGDFDLYQHQGSSGKALEVFDDEVKAAFATWSDEQKKSFIERKKNELRANARPGLEVAFLELGDRNESFRCERLFKGFYLPHVIEPSAGLDRLALAVLAAAYKEFEKPDTKGKVEKFTVMRFHPRVAPIKAGVFPLLKNKPELVAKAREVHSLLKRQMNCFYDESGAIGRRYARQDEAGTPFCVTIDFDTIGENGPELADTVTLRHRDGGEQERVKIGDLLGRLLPLVQ